MAEGGMLEVDNEYLWACTGRVFFCYQQIAERPVLLAICLLHVVDCRQAGFMSQILLHIDEYSSTRMRLYPDRPCHFSQPSATG